MIWLVAFLAVFLLGVGAVTAARVWAVHAGGAGRGARREEGLLPFSGVEVASHCTGVFISPRPAGSEVPKTPAPGLRIKRSRTGR